MDTRRRSWAKSFTWRVIGVAVLGAVSYLVTSDWKATTGITLLFHSIRMVLYYWHERLWERISWGKLKHPLSQFPVRADLTRDDYDTIRKFLDDQRYITEQPEYQI